MTSPGGLYEWYENYPHVKYAGMPIGEAILAFLREKAVDAAVAYHNKEAKTFQPYVFSNRIIEGLDEGGFDFRSTAPLREVNAALMKLNGVKKNEKSGRYATENADHYLAILAPTSEEETPQQSAIVGGTG